MSTSCQYLLATFSESLILSRAVLPVLLWVSMIRLAERAVREALPALPRDSGRLSPSSALPSGPSPTVALQGSSELAAQGKHCQRMSPRWDSSSLTLISVRLASSPARHNTPRRSLPQRRSLAAVVPGTHVPSSPLSHVRVPQGPSLKAFSIMNTSSIQSFKDF